MTALVRSAGLTSLPRSGSVVRAGRTRAGGRGRPAAALPGRPRPEGASARSSAACWNWPHSARASRPSACAWPSRAACRTSARWGCWCATSRRCASALEALMRYMHRAQRGAGRSRVEQVSNLVVIRVELTAEGASLGAPGHRTGRRRHLPRAAALHGLAAGSRGWCASRIATPASLAVHRRVFGPRGRVRPRVQRHRLQRRRPRRAQPGRRPGDGALRPAPARKEPGRAARA